MVNLLSQTQLNAEQKEYVKWIKDSSDILGIIINDILDISKINAGQMVFEQTPFSIYDVVRTLAFSMELKAKEKNIGFRTQMDCRVPDKVMGDSVRLLQVLFNLSDNAMKFTERGEVNISINKLKEDNENIYLEFVVLDTGIGIAPANIPGLFEPFVQATPETTRKYGGTGLGLSIAKRLVEMQGGTIRAESQLGLGSAFSFQMRFKKYEPETTPALIAAPKEEINESAISGLRVLLVEDNKISQRVGIKTMNKWGVIVDIAENGKQAVEKATANNYDVILMDIQMPVMDGFEATKKIRSSFVRAVSKVPIIAMTASVILLDKEKSLELGMDNYLSKPFKPEELYKILCDACPISLAKVR
jgi:CheY-like chemotaxis protein